MPRRSAGRLAAAIGIAAVLLIGLAARPVEAQPGAILIESPAPNDQFRPGDEIAVFARVVDFSGFPIGGVNVAASLMSGAQVIVVVHGLSAFNAGTVFLAVAVPVTLAPGTYVLEVSSDDPDVEGDARNIRIEAPPQGMVPTWFGTSLVAAGIGAFLVVALLARSSRRRNRVG